MKIYFEKCPKKWGQFSIYTTYTEQQKKHPAKRNFQHDATAGICWQRSHHYHPRLTRQKRRFYTVWSFTWACIVVFNQDIRSILGHMKRWNISLNDSVTWMKIYWQIKKKWQELLKITAKTCSKRLCSSSKNRSTEGCSKLKSPETRQVQEILISTLEHLQVPKWDRTRCPEEWASSVGMPHPLQMSQF